MASPKITLEELLESCGLEDASLSKKVENVEFFELSRYLTKWKLVALKLGISEADVDTIESKKVEMQGVTFLNVWKQRCAFKATYRALVDALLSIEQADDASGICQILKGKQLMTNLLLSHSFFATKHSHKPDVELLSESGQTHH